MVRSFSLARPGGFGGIGGIGRAGCIGCGCAGAGARDGAAGEIGCTRRTRSASVIDSSAKSSTAPAAVTPISDRMVLVTFRSGSVGGLISSAWMRYSSSAPSTFCIA